MTDFFSRNYSRPKSTLETIFSFKDVSDKTQQHLTKVYSLLLACVLSCAVGAYVNDAFFVTGFFMHLISFALTIYLVFQIHSSNDQ